MVARVREKLVTQGLDAVLTRKERETPPSEKAPAKLISLVDCVQQSCWRCAGCGWVTGTQIRCGDGLFARSTISHDRDVQLPKSNWGLA
jgi:hypothetical protein